MGSQCCRSRAKIYFAAHSEHAKYRPIAESLSLRDRESMHIFLVFEQMRSAVMESVERDVNVDDNSTNESINFKAFTDRLGILPTKLALNAYAHGCQVPRRAFPKVKEDAEMSLEKFLRCVTHICARTDQGIRALAFSLYKDNDSDGILAENMIRLVHDSFTLVNGEQIKGMEKNVGRAEKWITQVAQWDDKANEKRSESKPFSWEEFNKFMGKKRFMLTQVYAMQKHMRKSLGGSRMWSSVMARAGSSHSGFLKEVKWAPNRSLTFGSESDVETT